MSLAQLRREVNSIQRKLIHELRVVRARRVAENYCDLWADLVARKQLPPDPFRLLTNLRKHNRVRGDFANADSYLELCRQRRHLPHAEAIVYKLLHQEARMRLISHRWPEPVKY